MGQFLKILLIILIVFVVITGSSTLIRKVLDVKQESWGHNYVNAKHEKIDKKMRTLTIILIIFGTFVNFWRGLENHLWYFEPFIILFMMVFVNYIIKAIMEKRYKENKNYYIATLVETGVFIVFLFVLYQTSFFGLIT